MRHTQSYVAYYRVSTARQGASGLGLEAQRASVAAFIGSNVLQAEFTDIETGKNDNRPELHKALHMAKLIGATLLIAKLDRLSRNVTFISTLIDTHVKFTCCDMPEANELTIHLMSALAQWERKAISARTSAALQAKKARGEKIGNSANFTDAGRQAGHQAIRDKAANNNNNRRATVLAHKMRQSGNTLLQIATELNNAGFETSTGKQFTPTQVSRLIL